MRPVRRTSGKRTSAALFAPLATLLLLASLVAASRPGRAQPRPVPGQTLWGEYGHVEYVVGNLPLVISVPHGGRIEPLDVPDRATGTMVTDGYTVELARAISDALAARTGRRPHLIICHLRRTKLDCNRTIQEAAQGDPVAERAWRDFHAFIDMAKAAIVAEQGEGHAIDLHAHGHELQATELGYLLRAAELEQADPVLDADPSYAARSSIRGLAERSGASFSALLRGPESLGGLLQDRGFAAVPSPRFPDPGGRDYFDGGANTVRHGSRSGGAIDATQFETPGDVRASTATRAAYAAALAEVLPEYVSRWRDIDLLATPPLEIDAADAFAVEEGTIGVGIIRVLRHGDASEALTVPLVAEGPARADVDYLLDPPGDVVRIPAGASFVNLSVSAIDNDQPEEPKTVTFRLAAGDEVAGDNNATILLADDDQIRDLKHGLVAHWPMDGSGEVIADATGNGRGGRLGPDPSSGPQRARGWKGGGLVFDGRDDHVRIPGFAYAPEGGFTISLWLKAARASGAGVRYLFSHGASGAPVRLWLYLLANGGTSRVLLTDIDRPHAYYLDAPSDLMDDTWHHVALSAVPGRLARLYVDGEAWGRTPVGAAPYDPEGDLFIGGRSDLDGTRFFQGTLDDVRLYERALSEPEVRGLRGIAADERSTPQTGTATATASATPSATPAAGASATAVGARRERIFMPATARD